MDRIKVFKPSYLPSRKQNSRLYDMYERDAEARRFYKSAVWARCRKQKLAINPSCEQPGCIAPATQVHHIHDFKNYPDERLLMSNLESLCAMHHNLQRRAKRYG